MLCNSRLSIPRGPPNSQLDVFVSMGPSWATFENQKRSRTYGEHNRTIMNNQSKNDQNGRWSLDLYSTTVLYRHMWLHRSAHRPSFSTVSGSGCLVMPTPAKAPNPPRSLLRVLSFAGLSLKMAFAIPCLVYPLVMTKIAMENGPFIDGLLVYPLKMVIFHGELLVITRLGNCFCFNFPCLFIDQPVGQHLTTLRP